MPNQPNRSASRPMDITNFSRPGTTRINGHICRFNHVTFFRSEVWNRMRNSEHGFRITLASDERWECRYELGCTADID
eukprot:1333520-Amorphochlora_amoeboformis.AAC.1